MTKKCAAVARPQIRVLTYLKAALNHAYDEGHAPSNEAWGRKLKPFRDVEVARVRYGSANQINGLHRIGQLLLFPSPIFLQINFRSRGRSRLPSERCVRTSL